jgi:hypothetical protein
MSSNSNPAAKEGTSFNPEPGIYSRAPLITSDPLPLPLCSDIKIDELLMAVAGGFIDQEEMDLLIGQCAYEYRREYFDSLLSRSDLPLEKEKIPNYLYGGLSRARFTQTITTHESGKILGYDVDVRTGDTIYANTPEFDDDAEEIDEMIAKYKAVIANASNIFEEAEARRVFRCEIMPGIAASVRDSAEEDLAGIEAAASLGDHAASSSYGHFSLDPILDPAKQLQKMIAERNNDDIGKKLCYEFYMSYGAFFCHAVRIIIRKRLAIIDAAKPATTPEVGNAEHLKANLAKLNLIATMLSEVKTSLEDGKAFETKTENQNPSHDAESTKEQVNTSTQEILQMTRSFREILNNIDDRTGKPTPAFRRRKHKGKGKGKATKEDTSDKDIRRDILEGLEFPSEPDNPGGTPEGWIDVAADIVCDKRWTVDDLKWILVFMDWEIVKRFGPA